MGLFENLGRKVEEFKQEAVEASEDQATYACADCGQLIYTDREDCPECGSERVVERATTDAAEESDVAEDETAEEADASEGPGAAEEPETGEEPDTAEEPGTVEDETAEPADADEATDADESTDDGESSPGPSN